VAWGHVVVAETRSRVATMTMRQNEWTLGTYCATYCAIYCKGLLFLSTSPMKPGSRSGPAGADEAL